MAFHRNALQCLPFIIPDKHPINGRIERNDLLEDIR